MSKATCPLLAGMTTCPVCGSIVNVGPGYSIWTHTRTVVVQGVAGGLDTALEECRGSGMVAVWR